MEAEIDDLESEQTRLVNENKKLLGTLTDGDLRRSILAGVKFSEDISNCFNINPTTFSLNEYSAENGKKLLRDLKLDLIPIIDDDNLIVDYVTWSTLGDDSQQKKKFLPLDIPIVIMAGGKGTRMEPFTSILPKPLVPVRDKPIIEHIIERFTSLSCNDFYLFH